MGIFDGLNFNATNKESNTSESFTFDRLPESISEMKALQEAVLDTPFKAAALTVCALCAYAFAPDIGKEMLNFLKGPQPLSVFEQQFLKDRFLDKKYVPFSYFAGATPANGYTPSKPYKITVETNPYSYDQDGYCKLYLKSGGADSPRSIVLRKKGEQWFLWEQFLLADIRMTTAEDPWA